jgi:hypothetical protein
MLFEIETMERVRGVYVIEANSADAAETEFANSGDKYLPKVYEAIDCEIERVVPMDN